MQTHLFPQKASRKMFIALGQARNGFTSKALATGSAKKPEKEERLGQ